MLECVREGKMGPIEATGQVPGELDVLVLVLADWNRGGLVEQYVGGHQRRVGQQASAGALEDRPTLVRCRPSSVSTAGCQGGTSSLVLELCHPSQPAQRRCAYANGTAP